MSDAAFARPLLTPPAPPLMDAMLRCRCMLMMLLAPKR